MLFFRRKIKLVMSLLVRDEVDILEKNICFHLNSGVDKIVAIDNGSVDGTKEVLEKYHQKGLLEYWIINKHTYEQDKWVSGMAKKAKDMGATHILHCDADEFWYAKKGLKKSIENMGDVLYVPVRNILPPLIGEQNIKFLKRFKYEVIKTRPVEGNVEERKSSRLLFYEYPKKIITRSSLVKVGYGNDTVISQKKLETSVSSDICIFHFPIRSYKQFEQKVINGGSSYINNPKQNPSIGWHWKSWYKLYLKGKLKNEYKKLTLNNKRIENYLSKNIIKHLNIPVELNNVLEN